MELYIWGPVADLPSIDAECIAAVAFLARALAPAQWRAVSSVPAACPGSESSRGNPYLARTRSVAHLLTMHARTHADTLPALRDGAVWASGYAAIVDHVRAHHNPHLGSGGGGGGSDATPSATAYTALLAAVAQPLVDGVLYASEANWATVTRPAFGRMLAFPLSWTLPHAVRAAAEARARRLAGGKVARLLELLEQGESGGGGGGGDDEAVVVVLPDSEAGSASTMTQALASRLRPQQSVVDTVTKKVVRERLEGLARELLAPVVEGLEGAMGYEGEKSADDNDDDDAGLPLSARCLAYGYLALLAVEVPQGFARAALSDKARAFIDAMRRGTHGEGALGPAAASGEAKAPSRFVGMLEALGLPAYVDRNAVAAAAAGLLAYRVWWWMQPFGLPVHTFTRG
jgi:hypothetical protein